MDVYALAFFFSVFSVDLFQHTHTHSTHFPSIINEINNYYGLPLKEVA